MSAGDIIGSVTRVVEALDSLRVRYLISGSVASSAYGIARATLDVDLVADLHPEHVRPLLLLLHEEYYVDEERVAEAVQRRSSFSMVHLATMLKVDVFILKSGRYDAEALRRGREETLEGSEGKRSFVLASAEDVVLGKLNWYRLGGEVSQCQWNDVLGVLRVQGQALDFAYLRHWAAEIGLTQLLERAMNEAGR